MGSLFDSMELKILDSVFGASTSYQSPANYFVGLSTTTIAENASGITEPSGNAYARKGISNNKTTWANAAAGALDNAIAITFPQATPSGWGTILDFFLASVSGTGVSSDYVGYGSLTVSKTVQAGDTPSFAIGDLDITLT